MLALFHEPVSLSDPDPDWPSQYTAEAALIERELAAFDPVFQDASTSIKRPAQGPAFNVHVFAADTPCSATTG